MHHLFDIHVTLQDCSPWLITFRSIYKRSGSTKYKCHNNWRNSGSFCGWEGSNPNQNTTKDNLFAKTVNSLVSYLHKKYMQKHWFFSHFSKGISLKQCCWLCGIPNEAKKNILMDNSRSEAIMNTNYFHYEASFGRFNFLVFAWQRFSPFPPETAIKSSR